MSGVRLDCIDNLLIKIKEEADRLSLEKRRVKGTLMAESINADIRSELQEQRDLERLTLTRKLLEGLLEDLKESKPSPIRSDEPDPSPRAG